MSSAVTAFRIDSPAAMRELREVIGHQAELVKLVLGLRPLTRRAEVVKKLLTRLLDVYCQQEMAPRMPDQALVLGDLRRQEAEIWEALVQAAMMPAVPVSGWEEEYLERFARPEQSETDSVPVFGLKEIVTVGSTDLGTSPAGAATVSGGAEVVPPVPAAAPGGPNSLPEISTFDEAAVAAMTSQKYAAV